MSRRGTGPGGVRGDLATGRDLGTAVGWAEVIVHAASDPAGRPLAGRRRRHPPARRGGRPGPAAAPGLRLDRRRRPHPVRLLPRQVRGRAGAARLRAAGDPAARDAVPRLRRLPARLRQARPGPPGADGLAGRSRSTSARSPRTLTEVVAAPPSGGVVEFGGPEELSAADLARAWVAARAPGTHVVATPGARQAERRGPGRRGAALRRRPGTAHVRRAPARLNAAASCQRRQRDGRSGDGVGNPPENRPTRRLGSDRDHPDQPVRSAPDGRTIARRRRHPLRLGVGVRGDPRGGGGPLTRRAGPGPAARRLRGARPAHGRPRLGAAHAPGVGPAGRLRGRLVRRLQRGAQRRRAAPGRRHHGDAGQHRPDPDRGLRRAAPGRGLPAVAGRGHRGRLRRRGAHRRGHPQRRDRAGRRRAAASSPPSPTPSAWSPRSRCCAGCPRCR